MKREIKFRAKEINTNKWVYGYYAMRSEESPVPETTQWYCEHYILIDKGVNGFEEVLIDINTLCQLVTIRNGIEFYEHDILEDFLSIRWNDYVASFEFYWTYSGENTDGDISWCENEYVLKEVVGNIFDNPEMVENGVS